MISKLRGRVSSAHVIALAALFVALGGTAFAASKIGTNDIKNFHSLPRFKKEFGGLLYALRAKWPDARIVWQPVIALTDVPALPRALARLLETRARAINALGTRLCLERRATPAERLPITDAIAGFSSDGFHASEAGYRAWAEHLLPFVMRER